jgi:hypothetical protein
MVRKYGRLVFGNGDIATKWRFRLQITQKIAPKTTQKEFEKVNTRPTNSRMIKFNQLLRKVNKRSSVFCWSERRKVGKYPLVITSCMASNGFTMRDNDWAITCRDRCFAIEWNYGLTIDDGNRKGVTERGMHEKDNVKWFQIGSLTKSSSVWTV